jgi:uncharacterized membrane protein (DUF485 family)
MLLLASAAVAFGELATWLSMPILDTVSFLLLIGSALFVTTIILSYGVRSVREQRRRTGTPREVEG